MAATKTATLTLRIDPAVKEGLRAAAKREHRSIGNMIEVLIREHCHRAGISIPGEAATTQRSGIDKDRSQR